MDAIAKSEMTARLLAIVQTPRLGHMRNRPRHDYGGPRAVACAEMLPPFALPPPSRDPQPPRLRRRSRPQPGRRVRWTGQRRPSRTVAEDVAQGLGLAGAPGDDQDRRRVEEPRVDRDAGQMRSDVRRRGNAHRPGETVQGRAVGEAGEDVAVRSHADQDQIEDRPVALRQAASARPSPRRSGRRTSRCRGSPRWPDPSGRDGCWRPAEGRRRSWLTGAAAQQHVVQGGHVRLGVVARHEAVVAKPDVDLRPGDAIAQRRLGQQAVDRDRRGAAGGAEVGPAATLDGGDQRGRDPVGGLARPRRPGRPGPSARARPGWRREARDAGAGQSLRRRGKVRLVLSHGPGSCVFRQLRG